MASYPNFTLSDLADFSGRDVSEYENAGYGATAIKQATLLFKIGTCLAQLPENPIHVELAHTAILAMADAIYLAQPFQQVLSNPFSSETIGSYSYSKVAGAVAGGLPTGITWFDLAVSEMGVCSVGEIMGGGIHISSYEGIVVGDNFLGPAELNLHQAWLHDPSVGHAGAVSSESVQSGSVSGGGSSAPLPDNLDGGEL